MGQARSTMYLPSNEDQRLCRAALTLRPGRLHFIGRYYVYPELQAPLSFVWWATGAWNNDAYQRTLALTAVYQVRRALILWTPPPSPLISLVGAFEAGCERLERVSGE